MYYLFDWDDGTDSGWDGPYNSGDTVSLSHIWEAEGTYQVKVKAKDEQGAESVWSDPLAVSMPKSKNFDPVLFNDIIQKLRGLPMIFKLIWLNPHNSL